MKIVRLSKMLSCKSKCFLLVGMMFILTVLNSGCSGTGSSNNLNDSPSSMVTIDSAGVIPVFNNLPTATVVYVHNHTAASISGIKYKLSAGTVGEKMTSSNLPDSFDGEQCTTIGASQGCAVKIITPQLAEGTAQQGGMTLQASYELDGKSYTFTQVINYAQVTSQSQTNDGVKFSSGAVIYGYGHSSGYATLYLYANSRTQNYTIGSVSANKSVLKFMPVLEQQNLAVNQVAAVEVSAPVSVSSLSAVLTVKSVPQSASSVKIPIRTKSSKALLTGEEFSNSVNLMVEPTSSGAILTTGLVPLINTATSTSGSMLVLNSGNQPAQIGSVSAGSGISNLSGCSNSTLATGDSCSITFSVSEGGGSANITIPYSGGSAGSVVGNVTWYNGVGAPLVSMSAANNPLTFPATVGGSTAVTVTNVGGYTLEEISIPTPVVVGGSATATINNNTCTSSLAINASCSYVVTVADSATDLNQQINLGFIASYAGSSGSQSYSRVMPLSYSSTSYGAIISIDPSSASVTITGNNNESTTQVLTISNSGNVPANISRALSDNPAYLSESASSCGATLNADSSCTVTLQFGPTYSADSSSGSSVYTVNYTAAGQTPSGSESTNINWNVTAMPLPATFLVSYGDNGEYHFNSGNGSADNQYTGFNDVVYKVDVVFTNTSTTTANNFQSTDANNPPFVLANNGCHGVTLNQNESCIDTYALSTNDSQPSLALSSINISWSDLSGIYSSSIASAPTIYTLIAGSPKIIFITQNSYNGDLGGLDGANGICSTEASTQGFSGTYKALLNGNGSTTSGISYYRSDQRTLIAVATGGNLTFSTPEDDYSLVNSISTVADVAWTGFSDNFTCQNWTYSTYSEVEGIVGLTNAKSTDWGIVAPMPCSAQSRLYCVQQ